jgi:hypothetical protein
MEASLLQASHRALDQPPAATELPTKSAAQQITSAAAHIELILFPQRCHHHAIESAA